MHVPAIRSINLYPIKSLDPVPVATATVLASGALEHDREFALFDEEGKWINGKREPHLHRVRARFDLEKFIVTLSSEDQPTSSFHLSEETGAIEEWFEAFLGRRVSLRRNVTNGFPDDLESPGPTMIGSATLDEVSSWFDLDPGETRRRFRANIEIATDVPFWEDRLFDDADRTVLFHIGEVAIHGVNPCARCAVPSRDPSTGSVTPDFQRAFAAKRAELLPAWANPSRFDHYYRLAVNTRIPLSEAGKSIRVGDKVSTGLR